MIEKAKEIVNKVFDLELDTNSKKGDLPFARMTYYSLLHNIGVSLSGIGNSMKHTRTHATVKHALDNIDRDLRYNFSFKKKYNLCHQLFQEEIDKSLEENSEFKKNVMEEISAIKTRLNLLILQLKQLEDGTRASES